MKKVMINVYVELSSLFVVQTYAFVSYNEILILYV